MINRFFVLLFLSSSFSLSSTAFSENLTVQESVISCRTPMQGPRVVPGPRGPTGPTGASGATGGTGSTGATGYNS